MEKTLYFGFEYDIRGARVIVVRQPLMPPCASEEEIDYNIQLLKLNLDVVSAKMKKAVREQSKKSVFAPPTGPRVVKRPADVAGNTAKVMRIATGEEAENLPADDRRDPAAKALGEKGGAARAAKIAPERRVEIAKAAAKEGWRKG